jgi:putative ABC transport system permease protein
MSGWHWLRALMARLRALLGREAILRDIDEELESHLDLATEANIARGMPPAAARLAAVKSFGRRVRVQDQAYDVRGGGWLETIWQDLRQGGRMLRRNPGFAAVALLTLTVGIGATTAIFSVVNAVLLRPLPYPEADRLVVLKTTQRTTGAIFDSAMPDYRAWRDQTTAFEGLGAYYYRDMNLVGAGAYPERLQGARVSANLFSVLGVAPALGRGLRPEDEQFGRHQVVLLSHGLWQQRFSADPSIVGRTINLGGERHVVVGVMPAGMAFFSNQPPVQLWTPSAFAPDDAMNSRSNHYVRLVGRLRPGVTLARAQAQVDLVASRLEQQYEENKGLGGAAVALGHRAGGGRAPDAAGAGGGSGVSADGGLRECGQPAASAGSRPRARAGGARQPGRRARADRAAVAPRELAAGAAGRRGRAAAGLGPHGGAGRSAPLVPAAPQ